MIKNIVNTLLKEKTNNIFIQFFRYFFVGGIAYVVDFGLLYVLTEFFSLYYIASAAISFLAGLCVNYVISILWVFDKSKVESRMAEFIFFGIIGAFGLALNVSLIWVFTEMLLLYYLLSKIISTVFVYLWNFFARKFFLFN